MLVYLVMLGAVIGVGLGRFSHLFEPMLPPEAAEASIGVGYGRYLALTQGVLAAALGGYAGLYGISRRSRPAGLLTLVAGVIVTALGYSFMPALYFPGGDMTAWLLWLCNVYVYLGVWALTSAVGQAFPAVRAKLRGVRTKNRTAAGPGPAATSVTQPVGALHPSPPAGARVVSG